MTLAWGEQVSTFDKATTEVGAGAITEFLNESLGLVLVGSVHDRQTKVEVDLSVIRHQRQTITLLHCSENATYTYM